MCGRKIGPNSTKEAFFNKEIIGIIIYELYSLHDYTHSKLCDNVFS
jgi:hypothetical protein